MKRTRYVAALAAAAFTAGSVPAFAVLNVDFGLPAGPVEPGYSAFPLNNATNYQGTFFDYAGTDIDNGSPIRVTVGGTATGTAAQRVVNRTPTGWTGGQTNLLRDWIGIDARTGTAGNGTDTTVTIANLAPGYYTYRSYHTDIGTGGNQSPTFDFLVNNSLQYNNFQVRGQVGAAPTTTPNFLENIILSDGVTPVTFTYRLSPTTAGDKGFPVINGFDLNPLETTGDVYRIDIDSSNGAPVETAAGWTSLDATEPSNGDSVTVNGTTFTVFSADGSRNRTTSPTPNAITRDFIFDDGANAAVGLTATGLDEGYYLASIWAWDDLVPTTTGDQIVGYITGPVGPSPETIIGTFQPDPNDPIVTFLFHADGVSQYSFFTRESNTSNRARFNALQLISVNIPEPATGLLALLGAGVLVRRRQRCEG